MPKIRRAVAEDEEDIVTLLREFPEDPEVPNVNWEDAHKALPELLKGEKGSIFVAEEDGVVAGLVTLSFSYVLRFGGEYALIEDFIVGAKFRGRGIGSPLLKAAFEEASSRGWETFKGLGIEFPSNSIVLTVCLIR